MASGALRGHPLERPTRDLAGATADWMIAVRRVAASGAQAWSAMDAPFPPDTDEPLGPSPAPSEGPAEMIAELDMLVVYLTGDRVLDQVAYAELVRRDRVPRWRPGRLVPPMWPKFMDELDAGPLDRMASSARYLDVTLAVARDVLVAHPDPAAVELPSFSSWGEVRLHRPVLDPDRRAEAERVLRALNGALEHPWPLEWSYDHLLDTILAVPVLLTREMRDGLRTTYRLAGFESPKLTSILQGGLRLLGEYQQMAEAAVGT